jgi:hypothetical protein
VAVPANALIKFIASPKAIHRLEAQNIEQADKENVPGWR